MRSDNIRRVITEVGTSRGAPMGRSNIGYTPPTIQSEKKGEFFAKKQTKIYDKRVPMCSCCGAYDIGGAYWGYGKELRVRFTADLSYIEFYRKEN